MINFRRDISYEQEGLKHMGVPEEITANWVYWTRKPGVAITFDVEKVFG